MRFDRNRASSGPVNWALFVLDTLLAWTALTLLFLLLKRAPLTHADSFLIDTTLLSSFLPWLTACLFWVRARKRAKLGKIDRETYHFLQIVITNTLVAAYIALMNMEILLLWIMPRPSRT